jgi:P-type Ca2+ transporter type 2C
VMSRKPERHKRILTPDMKKIIIWFSILADVALFSLFLISFYISDDITYARTLTFVALGVSTLLYIFSVRSLRESIFKTPFFSNAVLWLGVVTGFMMYIVALYVPPVRNLLDTVPLGRVDWLIVFCLGLFNVAIFESLKWKFLRSQKSMDTESVTV